MALNDSFLNDKKTKMIKTNKAAGGTRGRAKTKEGRKPVSKELDTLQLYLRDIEAYDLLTPEEEGIYGRLALTGDRAASDKMITCNLRLVVKIARRYLNRGLSLADLIEEGNFGLMHAVEKFDPERGFRFSTYATWWIRQNIERALMNQTRTIRLPIHINKELNAYIRKQRELVQTLGREPKRAEIAEALEVSVDHINKLLSYNEKVSSLDISIGDEGDSQLVDFVSSETDEKPTDLLETNDMNKSVGHWLDQLSSKHKEVLIRRFGLLGYDSSTLEQVGREMGLTRERVRQIQMDGIKKLRRIMENNGYSGDSFLG